MALSQSVSESIEEAKSSLRNALAFAARQEHPFVSKTLAESIFNLHMLQFTDKMLTELDESTEERK